MARHTVIELRDARPDDAIQVADLLHLAQGKASIPIHGLGSLELALQFYRWMFARDGTFWSNDMTTVAVDGQKVVGLVACYPNDEQRESRSIRNNAAIREFFGTSGALVEYFRRRQAYSDGTPSFTASRGIYVMNLAVSPDYRRRGVAEMLLNVPDEACLRLGYVCCCLHAEEGNRPARKLFEKRGYSIQASGSGQGCQELCGFGGSLFMVRHPPVVLEKPKPDRVTN